MIYSAGIIPIAKTPEGYRFLLLRCFNYWDFPKGECDPGEDLEGTAVRELQEETGLSVVHFPWGNDFKETEMYSRQKVARYYLGEVTMGEIVLLPNPESGMIEHHEYRWVTFDEAMELLGPRVQKILTWAYEKIR